MGLLLASRMVSITFSPHMSTTTSCRSSFRLKRMPIRSDIDRQSLFDRIAPVYDNLNDLLSMGQHRIWKRMAVSWSGARTGDTVLDLCCGSGDLAFVLSEKVGSSGKVIGLDFASKQLDIAFSRQQFVARSCYKNIEWVEGDALDLPFSEGFFDAITVGYGLRNLVDRPRAMQEIFRVLKPGARLSILDFNKSKLSLTTIFQEWMIDNVVVPTATVHDLAKEYMYLKDSIRNYLTGYELEALALEIGFSEARHYEISGGLMGNLVATRIHVNLERCMSTLGLRNHEFGKGLNFFFMSLLFCMMTFLSLEISSLQRIQTSPFIRGAI